MNNRSALFVCVGIAFVLRLVTLLQSLDNPLVAVPLLDEAYYVDFAKKIAGGYLIGENTAFQLDPLYGYYLGLLFFIFGEDLIVPRVIQLFADTLNVYLIYILGKKTADERTGLLAAFFYALYKVAFFYSCLLLKTTFAVTFTLLFLLAAINVSRKGRSSLWFYLGAFAGLLCLLRSNFALFAVAVPIIYWLESRPAIKVYIKHTILFCVGVWIVLGASTARNYIVSGEMVVVRTQGGATFFVSNNAGNLTGRYNPPSFARRHPVKAPIDFHREAERRTGQKLSETEASSYWGGEGMKFLLNNPDKALLLVYNKLKGTLGNEELPANVSIDTWAIFAPVLAAPFPNYAFVIAFGLPGLLIAPFRRREALWLFLPVAVTMGTILIFYTSSRLRIPMVPSLLVGAGITLTLLFDWLRGKRYIPLIATSILVVVIFVTSMAIPLVPFGGNDRYLLAKAYWRSGDIPSAMKLAEEGFLSFPDQERYPVMMGAIAISAERYDIAQRHLNKALAIKPDNPEGLHNSGVASLGLEDYTKAIDYLERTRKLQRPINPATLYALAKAYKDSGDVAASKKVVTDLLGIIRPADPLAVKAKELF